MSASAEDIRGLYIPTILSCVRYWQKKWSPTEVLLLTFIADRTLRFGKEEEVITLDQFTHGVLGRNGPVIAGLGLSRPTILKAYKSLEKKGFLFVQSVANKAKGYLNSFKINVSAILSEKVIMSSSLNISKKYREMSEEQRNSIPGKESLLGGERIFTGGVKNLYCKGVDFKMLERSKRKNAAFGRIDNLSETNLTAEETLDQATQRVTEKQKEKARKLTNKPTLSGLTAAWKSSTAKHGAGQTIVSPTRKDLHKLLAGCKAHSLPHDTNLISFIDWSVEHWAILRQGPLSWAENMSNNPDMASFSSLYKFFVKAYGDMDSLGAMEKDRARQAEARVEDNTNQVKAMAKQLKEATFRSEHLARLVREKGTGRVTVAPEERLTTEQLRTSFAKLD